MCASPLHSATLLSRSFYCFGRCRFLIQVNCAYVPHILKINQLISNIEKSNCTRLNSNLRRKPVLEPTRAYRHIEHAPFQGS